VICLGQQGQKYVRKNSAPGLAAAKPWRIWAIPASPALLGQRPASHDRSPSQPQRKFLFGRDRNDLFCLLLRDCPLLAKVLKQG
jgi:hypothetical protein